jgi:membrane-bound lytic murein transglycosylase D
MILTFRLPFIRLFSVSLLFGFAINAFADDGRTKTDTTSSEDLSPRAEAPKNPEENAVVFSMEIQEFENNEIPTDTAAFIYTMERMEFEIPMSFNAEVKRMIDFFGTSWQSKLKEMATLSEYYFPIYESILDKHNLPLEFKYLSIVESGLNPRAVSRAGAVGLWQFMPYTGKVYDLQIDRYVDERKDIYKSTEAACQYFEDMHAVFDDWLVVIASYNCGPGNVRKAMRASGGKKTFWEIYPYLPRETRNYVPSFIAVTYLMNTYEQFGITPAPVDLPEKLYAISIPTQYDLTILAEQIGTTSEEIRRWNPALKSSRLPLNKTDFTLYLPEELCYLFIENEISIAEKSAEKEEQLVEKTHVVRKGESLQLIARKNGCSVSELKDWNDLRGTVIHPGQKLVLLL